MHRAYQQDPEAAARWKKETPPPIWCAASSGGRGVDELWIGDATYITCARARQGIFTWLNWYNQTRLHSPICNRPPTEYEQHLAQRTLLA